MSEERQFSEAIGVVLRIDHTNREKYEKWKAENAADNYHDCLIEIDGVKRYCTFDELKAFAAEGTE